MRTRLLALFDALRSSFWFIPTIMASAAAALALWLVTVGPTSILAETTGFSWLYGGGAEGARAVLAAIVGSMITVVSITFTITIVVLTLTAQQFGPRLLRTFLRDDGTKTVLGTLLGTYVYCLIVLRSIHAGDDSAYVPAHAVTVGVLLAVASIGALIYFVHHIVISIQASTVIARVSSELSDAIDRLFPSALGESPPAPAILAEDRVRLDALEQRGRPVPASVDGYLQQIDAGRLMRVACAQDLLIRVTARPGQFVHRGATVAIALASAPVNEAVTRRLASAFLEGRGRSERQDALFVLDQLVEIALRALSPAVNDPFTAMTCVDRIGAALCALSMRDQPSPYRFDADGRLRVVAPLITFADAIDGSMVPICRSGRSQPPVLERALAQLGAIAECARTEQNRALLVRHAEFVRTLVHAQGFHGDDQRRLDRAVSRVVDLATRRPDAREAG